MSDEVLETNLGALPQFVPLVRHVPSRVRFDWKRFNPAAVTSAGDLPGYLVLGPQDEDAFARDHDGWHATWRTTDDSDGWLRIGFNPSTGLYRLQQSWRGIDGGFSQFPGRMQLDQILGQGLYQQFPASWDATAKDRLEATHQLTYFPQPAKAVAFFGVPDGAFRTIAFIATAKNLRPIRAWLHDAIATAQPDFPVSAEARLLVQVVNYVEGRAPDWTTVAPRCYHQSLLDTGLAALELPVREQGSDGTAAWTIRRMTYAIFISVPFAGLGGLLKAIEATNGFVRPTSATMLRSEFRPVIFPQGIDLQVPSISTWDSARSARSTLVFGDAESRIRLSASWVDATDASIEQSLEASVASTHASIEQSLATIERTSAATIESIEKLLGL